MIASLTRSESSPELKSFYGESVRAKGARHVYHVALTGIMGFQTSFSRLPGLLKSDWLVDMASCHFTRNCTIRSEENPR